MPRVVVPTESEQRAADYSHRRRRLVFLLLAIGSVLAAGAFGVKTYRERAQRASADTVFVSTPAWPKAEPRQAPPKPPGPNKEFLLQVGAYTDKRDAEALAQHLAGLDWPVSVVVPVRATDSLHKVIVSGFEDRATARRVADSLSSALRTRVTIIEPLGTRSK